MFIRNRSMFDKSVLRNLDRPQKGFTLVEVMVCVLILSFVTVATMAMFAKCSLFAGSIRGLSIVNNALNERMEEIRDMPYSTITGLSTNFVATGFNEINNAEGVLTINDPFTDDDIKEIVLTVNWATRQGRAMTKSMSTYMTNDGINRQ